MKQGLRNPLETRRELLVARVAFQRFELRSHIGALRSSQRGATWHAGLLASVAIVGVWMVLPRNRMAAKAKAFGAVRLAARLWTFARALSPFTQR